MPAKNNGNNNARRWTATELEEGFAKVLADFKNRSASCLERLALLTKSPRLSNNEVFEYIKNIFEKYFEGKRYKKLDCTIEKLRQ